MTSYNCVVCNSSFKQKANLTRHYRIHTRERRYECDICNKSFIEKCKLKIHHQVHSGTKNYQCQECGRTFAENRNLRQHQLIHSGLKPHKCELCDCSFRYISDFKEHQLVHHTVKSQLCSLCGGSFKSMRTLKKHIKSFHEGVTEILISKNTQVLKGSDGVNHKPDTLHKSADELLTSENTSKSDILYQKHSSTGLLNLESPIVTVLVPESIETSGIVSQQDTNLLDISSSLSSLLTAAGLSSTKINKFPKDQQMIQLASSEVSSMVTREVTAEESTNDDIETFYSETVLNETQDYKSLGLSELSAKKYSVLNTQFDIQPLAGSSSAPLPDVVQNALFNEVDASQTLLLLSQHKQKDEIKFSTINLNKAQNLKYTNSVTQTANSKNKLETVKTCIKKIGNSTKHLGCKICKISVQYFEALKQHKKIHKSLLNQCQICSKLFSKRSNLMQHLKIHFGVKEFCCDTCGQMFLLHSALKSHLKVHNSTRPFKCSSCDREFKNRCDLVNHLRVHSGSKPYQCSICGRTFSLNSSLRRHNRVHSGDLPYSCSICDRRFSQNGNMHKHINSYHVAKDNSICT